MQIEEPFPEPMLLATTVELYDGLVAHGLPGQGRLAEVADTARYDAVHHHVDVLVVGAGPGRAWPPRSAPPAPGPASSWSTSSPRPAARCCRAPSGSTAPRRWTGSPPRSPSWPRTRTCCTCSAPPRSAATTTGSCSRWSGAPTTSARPRPSTCPASGCGASAPARSSSRPGAHERPVVFADNDRPGIMLAGAARTFLHRYGVLAGPRGRRVHHERQRLRRRARPAPTPACGCRRWSTPGRRAPRAAARSASERGHPGPAAAAS